MSKASELIQKLRKAQATLRYLASKYSYDDDFHQYGYDKDCQKAVEDIEEAIDMLRRV